MEEIGEPGEVATEPPAEPAPVGPPNLTEADFSNIEHLGVRRDAWKEYQRTLEEFRREGRVNRKEFRDFKHLVFPPTSSCDVYDAHKRACDDICYWQDEQRELEEKRQKEIAQQEERERERQRQLEWEQECAARRQEEAEEREREAAEQEVEDIGASPWAIPESEFAKARERLDRLKQRLARIERGEPPEQQPDDSASFASNGRVLIRGVQVDAGQRSRLHSYHPTVPRLDIARAPESLPDDVDTERLLNALIGECHFLMREVAFASMCQSAVLEDRMDWVKAAMNLATTGAKVAKSVARLRHGPAVKETRHAMVIENKVAAVVQGGGGCANP